MQLTSHTVRAPVFVAASKPLSRFERDALLGADRQACAATDALFVVDLGTTELV